MTILVTGVGGFVGHHLANELYSRGHRVIGTGMSRKINEGPSSTIDLYIGDCDLTKWKDVEKLPLNELDAVINLAGLAQVGDSFGKEGIYNKVNVGVHTTLADAIQKTGRPIRMVSVSTGAVYDNHQTMPLNESSQLVKDGSPYALSKVAMEEALQKYIRNGVDIVVARPFNHIGPGQLPGFLVPDLVQQVMVSKTVSVGNLKTERDYTDVRDVVKAYIALATKPSLDYQVYNICSGVSTSGQTILNYILDVTNKTDVAINIDPLKIRPNDPVLVLGDSSRIQQETGWKPIVPLKQTIADFVNALE